MIKDYLLSGKSAECTTSDFRHQTWWYFSTIHFSFFSLLLFSAFLGFLFPDISFYFYFYFFIHLEFLIVRVVCLSNVLGSIIWRYKNTSHFSSLISFLFILIVFQFIFSGMGHFLLRDLMTGRQEFGAKMVMVAAFKFL